MSSNDEVIAVEGVKPPAPWVLLESSSFSGRFYFFNTTTLESQWSLPEILFNENQKTKISSSLNLDDGNDDSGKVTDSLFAAQEAVRRMEARYGASPSRPDSEITTNALSSSSSKSSTAFSKRARDLDPRLMSIDLEEQLTNALNKADNIEKSWASLVIPEEVEIGQGLSKQKKKTPTNKARKEVPKSPLIPSAESFKAMSLRENEDGGEEMNRVNNDGGGGGKVIMKKNNSLPLTTSYVVISGLGSGGYSNVLLVKENSKDKTDDDHGLLAMKVLSKKLLKRPRDRARLRNELRALTEIPPSRFTQHCFAAFETPSHVCFVTEYLCGGDMFFHLTSRVEDDGEASGFPESEARILIAEIVLGLLHMHKHRFIHCDIKVENVMLDAKGHVKLIDFGLSQEMNEEEEPMSPIGSLIYMAPELLTKSTGGRHTDWWALGVLAHEMLTGRSPWSSLTDKKLIKKQIRSMKIQPPPSLSQGASDFICDLLIQDWHERLGTKDSNDVKSALFFKGDSESKFSNKIDWIKQENGTAPSALIPPEIAFIQSECDNALKMYQGSECSDANWSLGVEEVESLPPVKKSANKRKPPSQRASSSSSSNKNNSMDKQTTNVPSPRGRGGGNIGSITSSRSTSPKLKNTSTNTTSSSASSSTTIKKGFTPKTPKPKTPRVPLENNRPRLQKSNSKASSSATWK